MKKTIMLSVLLLVLVGYYIIAQQDNQYKVKFVDGGEGVIYVSVKSGLSEYLIKPLDIQEMDVLHFFFPSYLENKDIWCGEADKNSLEINGQKANKSLRIEDGAQYQFDYEGRSFKVCFYVNSNNSSLFISTSQGNMNIVHANKEYSDNGTILAVDAKGHVEYNGKLKEISGRGNATWWVGGKLPYNIELEAAVGLAGMSPAKDWELLALWFDGDKIHSKLAFNIAEILEATYTVESNWVDLYLNGEYAGLYLLTQSLSNQKQFNMGGDEFLLSKEISGRYQTETYVMTEDRNPFVIVRPKKPSEEQLLSIETIVRNAEDSIARGELENVIDVESFAIQFLVDEIAMNFDAFSTSAYIYKESGDNLIYAGPAWDYDGAYGEYLHMGEEWVNTDNCTLDIGTEISSWYDMLYDNEEFMKCVIEKYKQSIPQLQQLFTDEIERYASQIKKSVRNDNIRWNWLSVTDARPGIYQSWDNNVRYLEYFCLNRLNALNDRWNVDDTCDWKPLQEQHNVKFQVDDSIVYEMTTNDGSLLDIGSVTELANYSEGAWVFAHSGEIYNNYLPILEDCVLVYTSESTKTK